MRVTITPDDLMSVRDWGAVATVTATSPGGNRVTIALEPGQIQMLVRRVNDGETIAEVDTSQILEVI